jgi:two-component system OmpR family response regulator
MTNAQPLVLLIGDDPDSREEMASYLGAYGIRTAEAADDKAGAQILCDVRVDLVVADLAWNGGSDMALSNLIRSRSGLRSILITEDGDSARRVFALELGADDCIAKPVNLRDLLQRIVHFTGAPASHEQRPCSRWKFDSFRRSLSAPDGTPVPLTTAECDLLIALVNRTGEPQTRDALCRHVFNREWQPFDRGLDAVVVKLRRKLKDDSENPEIIKTVRSRGYVFTGFPD